MGDYFSGTAYQTLTEHWDGSTWTVVTSADPTPRDNTLFSVAAGPTELWAVGYYNPSVPQTLVEHHELCAPTATPIPPSHTPTPAPTTCPIQFTDVPSSYIFYSYIRCLACRGLINGYPDGTFRPENDATRGQISKIVSNAAGFDDVPTGQQFEDVYPGMTFYPYIYRLSTRGYISGYPCGGPGEPCIPPARLPYFRANANATRGQVAKIDSNAANFTDPPFNQQFQDIPPDDAFYPFIYRLAIRNIVDGHACGGAGEPCVPPDNLPYFTPGDNVKRGQLSKIVANTFLPDCQTPSNR